MRNLRMFVVLMALFIGVVGVGIVVSTCMAADNATPAPNAPKATVEKAPPAEKPIRVEGTLTKIEGKTLTVTIEIKGDDGSVAKNNTAVTVNDATKVTKREDKRGAKAEVAKFEDLTVGQSVRVYYYAKDKDTNVATSIVINIKPANAAPEAPKAPVAPTPKTEKRE